MITGLDPEASKLEIGVRRLIELVPTPGPLTGFDGVDLRTRTRAHNSYIRREVKRGAESEVRLSLRENILGVDLRVTGRADLLYRTNGLLKVHEVKTSLNPPADPLTEAPSHVLQLLFYCRALLEEDPSQSPEAIQAALVYVSPFPGDASEPVEVPVEVFGEDCSRMWRNLTTRVCERVAEYLDRRRRQLSALESFPFPYHSLRTGQSRMIEEVSNSVRNDRPLLLRAPTGSGKTVAVLCGAIPECVRAAKRLFFLTAKNTQKRTVAAALDRITENLPVKALFLRSKDELCPEDREVCIPSRCPRAVRFAERIAEAGSIDRLLSAGVIRGAAVLEEALSTGVCPFELALAVSVWCEVIVCDYNYVYDPHVALRRFLTDDSDASRCVVLLDEAANLPPRTTGYYSPRVRRSWLNTVSNRHPLPSLARIAEPWRRLLDSLDDRLEAASQSQIEVTGEVSLPTAGPVWSDFLADVDEPSRALLDLLRSCRDMDSLQSLEDDRFRLIADRSDGDLFLQLYCTDPSPELGAAQERLGSVVAFSATLNPADHYLDLLGLDGDTRIVDTQYPFPEENLGVWADPRVDTRYRVRPRTLPLLARRITRLYETAAGTYLVFMPSFRYLDMLESELRQEGMELRCQRRGMSFAQRERFFARAMDQRRSIVLTVSGGIFSEGIEFDSPHLKGAVVVGPSLPGMDLRRRMLIERYQRTGGDGFYRAMVVPGMTRAVQAAGRLVRSASQRGVIVLMGSRFTSPELQKLLPSYWLQDGRLPVLSESMSEIERFWQQKREPEQRPAPFLKNEA